MGKVLPFLPVGADVIPLHGDRGDNADGLAPQERTVIKTAHDIFDESMRRGSVGAAYICGLSADEGTYEAYRLSQEIPQPLRAVPEVDSRD